jgi:nucleoside-triphosphatase THEP1
MKLVFQPNTGGILVLDEIGCMELLSDQFKQEVKKAFSNPSITILATIPVRSMPFIENLRQSPNTTALLVSLYDNIGLGAFAASELDQVFSGYQPC